MSDRIHHLRNSYNVHRSPIRDRPNYLYLNITKGNSYFVFLSLKINDFFRTNNVPLMLKTIHQNVKIGCSFHECVRKAIKCQYLSTSETREMILRSKAEQGCICV